MLSPALVVTRPLTSGIDTAHQAREATFSDDHLGDALSTQGLAPDEALTLETGQSVEDGSHEQNHRGGDQTRHSLRDAGPLDRAHDGVDRGPHVIRRDSSDERVELGGGRADAEEEGDLDEDEYDGATAVAMFSALCRQMRMLGTTHRQTILKARTTR